MKILNFALILLFSYSITFSDSKDNELKYIKKLKTIVEEIKNKKNPKVDHDLISFLYENRFTFPDLTKEEGSKKKIEIIIPIYTNVSLVYSDLIARDTKTFIIDHAQLLGIITAYSARLTIIFKDFISKLNKEDPQYNARLQGLRMAQDGLIQVLQGVLHARFNVNHDDETNAIVEKSINECFKPIFNFLSLKKQKYLLKIMDLDIKPKLLKELQAEYTELIKSVLSAEQIIVFNKTEAEKKSLIKRMTAFDEKMKSKDIEVLKETLKGIYPTKEDFVTLFPDDGEALWNKFGPYQEKMILIADKIGKEIHRGGDHVIVPYNSREGSSRLYTEILKVIKKDIPIYSISRKSENGGGHSSSYIFINT